MTAQDMLNCIDAAFANKPDLKCDLVAVDPNQAKDVFDKDFLITKGQPATLAKTTTWPYVRQAILSAVTATSPPPATTFKLQIALRADIPDGITGCYSGLYVMLMSFDQGTIKLFLKGNLVGMYPIRGDRNYRQLRRILRDVAPAASAGSS
jgi:hypothetical protein